MTTFDCLRVTPNANRGRLSNAALSLTFGAQTGRGSDRSCVIRRTLEPVYQELISKVHELAQNAAGAALPYLGIQILKLEAGQELNQHRDYQQSSGLSQSYHEVWELFGRIFADVEV